jgi:hypothetical protein
MSQTVVLAGVNYTIPDPGDQPNWATGLTPYLVALASVVSSDPAFMQPVEVSSTPTTMISGKTYLVNTSSIAITLNLPAPAENMWMIIKDATGNAASNNITIHRPGAQTIDGVASDKVLSRGFGTWLINSNGTNYFVLNDYTDITGSTNAVLTLTSTKNIQASSILSSNLLLADGTVPMTGALRITPVTNQLVLGTTNTTTINATAPAASRVYTLPDAGGAANFLLSAGAQTITGAKTFSDQTLLLQETGSTDTVTIAVAALAASRVYTMPDAGGAADFLLSVGAQTITGAKTFADQTLLLQEAGSTDVITINVASLAASRAYTMPDAGGSADFVMNAGAQTIAGAKTFNDLRGTFGANIAAGGFILTGLGAGAAAGNSLRFEQLKVIQIVSGTSTTAFTTTSSSYQTTNLSASITPTSASNKVLVIASASMTIAADNVNGHATIARGGSNILGLAGQSRIFAASIGGQALWPTTIVYIDSPASTSSLTYAVQIKNSNNTSTVGYGFNDLTQFIVLAEVVA